MGEIDRAEFIRRYAGVKEESHIPHAEVKRNRKPEGESMLDKEGRTGESGEGEGGDVQEPTAYRPKDVYFEIVLHEGRRPDKFKCRFYEDSDGTMNFSVMTWPGSELLFDHEVEPEGEIPQLVYDLIEARSEAIPRTWRGV